MVIAPAFPSLMDMLLFLLETKIVSYENRTPSNLRQVQCRECGLERVNNDHSLHLASIVFVVPTFDAIL